MNPGLRSNSPGVLGSVSRFWHKSYAPDYLGFALLFTGYIVVQFLVEPFHRMFSLSDLRISFPHAEVERVPLSLDFVYALFIPLIFIIVYNTTRGASTHKHHVAILGLAIAMILASFLTDVVKNAVGRPRPDLLARCKPKPGTPHDILVGIDVCTEASHHTLHDGWRSFPSGHSSFSFAGLGYLSLFLAGQMRIFAHGAHQGIGEHTEKLVRGDLVRALLCLAPLLGATMIAISRCQDYRHDVYDVCIGGLLGWTVTYWSYRRYWPRLGSSRCDEPYAGPPAAQDSGRYDRVRDEEEGVGLGQNVGSELHQLR
ncbi:phosphatidic acid phosphatase type 2/haloperoxidase [Diplogelasinospora grovesii]|uniref:Phosphatidic acid phosphatase type 2/haloperoxidase n=1 Tax=Diplogelasinospora grovesii TaxID=303347 RepID=A0AAN6S5C9_9PEZI|nr:phosphatidic acid phosphatase type 2/haloperoxidase [Diplogelasinospora grovesii]